MNQIENWYPNKNPSNIKEEYSNYRDDYLSYYQFMTLLNHYY